MSISGLFGGENFDEFMRSDCVSAAMDPTREEKLGTTIHRLPLFSRCPITNEARLENPMLEFLDNRSNRIPLNSISNVPFNPENGRPQCLAVGGSFSSNTGGIVGPVVGFNNSPMVNRHQQHLDLNQLAQQQPGGGVAAATNNRLKTLRSPIHKPSLDEVKDNSIVALTNKFGKGKYWFKSASPTPDPRWSAEQQLMIGPIPGDVEYSQLRSAFLAQGHTLHLFIQNNQGWLEKNQEKFGPKHVKFGYVVYTERETARRLLHNGFVPVGSVKIRVKEMDGQPAVFL